MVILFDRFNLPDSIYEVVFSTQQQMIVAEMLIKYIKQKGGTVDKSEMSKFATDLHEGKAVYQGEKVSYNKRQFYDRILTPMKGMGLVSYDMYKRLYSISKKFHDALHDVADMWIEEYEKQV